MKKLILVVLLSGCQITIAKLPDPVNSELAATLSSHEQALKVLAEDYNKRNELKKK